MDAELSGKLSGVGMACRPYHWDGAHYAVGQNSRAQTTAAIEKFLCAGRECAVHPVAGPTFLCSEKAHTLNVEFHSDQFVQINIARDHIAPSESR